MLLADWLTDCVGSPWRVEVRNQARVSVKSSGLHQMSVGKVATFELHSTDPDSDITVNVTRMYYIYTGTDLCLNGLSRRSLEARHSEPSKVMNIYSVLCHLLIS